MKITFLGTGTSMGIPLVGCSCAVCHSDNERDQRLRTAIMVEEGSTRIVVDCGPDFRYQMLQYQVSDISALLITHEHNDHIAGLDDVRAFNIWHKKPVEVYTCQRVQEKLKLRYPYIFAEKKYPGAPSINFNPIDNHTPFSIGSLKNIQPIEVIHGNLAVTCFRFGDFTYITDASYIAPAEIEKIKGTKFLVINALRKEPEHWSHFILHQAIEIIKVIQPEKAYLTHISHQMGLYAEVEATLPTNIHLAYDGLTLPNI